MEIEHLRDRIEQELRRAISNMGEKNQLRDACEYALLNGGKRLRPLLVLMIAEALQNGLDVIPAALSVEFFHTASLIADDLPCMDDDNLRRGLPSLHRAFPEEIAILASYTLIATGYGGIAENQKKMKTHPTFAPQADAVAISCLEAATRCAGLNGATHGQFLDLYPGNFNLDTFRKIVRMKTSSLFEVSFLFGWLFGGGDPRAIEKLKTCANHLGMAFQIADDLDDDAQDERNLIHLCGREAAEHLFEQEILSFQSTLEELGLWTPSFQKLFAVLNARQRLCTLFLSDGAS